MIGERLYDLRKDFGYTQQQLADMLSLTKFTISSYEKEKTEPSDEIKIKLAQIFNTSVDYLVGFTDDSEPRKPSPTVIKLPEGLPEFAEREIIDFAGFLIEKYKRR